MISASDFERSVGKTFTVDAGAKQVQLELNAVRPLSSSARPGGYKNAVHMPRHH